MNRSSDNRESILIVDDTPDNLRLLVSAFSDRKYRIRTAIDVAHARTTISRQRPDLILLDIMMPGVDGFDFCRELKKDPETKDIPIIFLSALDEVNDKIRGLEEGGVDYITKPFDIEEVLARVRVHLDIVKKSGARRTPRYAKTGLSREKIGEIISIIRNLLESDPLWLDPDFSIDDLSEHTGIQKHNISESINNGLEVNFNSFINGYRIHHVQEQIRKGRHREVTLLSLAFEAGFNSKSSFNAFFKKSAGITPREYIRKVEEGME